jgi:hypothetical protein
MSDHDIQNQPNCQGDRYKAQQDSSHKHCFQPVSQSVDPEFSTERWKPSLFGSVPWTGFAALVVAIISTVGIVTVFHSANGKAVDLWPTEDRPIQLTVLLAVLIAIANLGLGVAFHEGRTLTWWIGMSKGATLEECHRHWEHGSSALQSVWGLFCLHPNRVTLVSIIMAMTFVNGPLIQRAVRINSETTTYPSTFHAALSTDQFSQPTAYYMTRAYSINTLATNFSHVLLAYKNRDPIKIDLNGCQSSCEGILVGAGFDVSCARGTMDYSIDPYGSAGETWRLGNIGIGFDGLKAPATLSLDTIYKGSADAEGHLTVTNCTLHSALVQYPFSYLNSTITLRESTTSTDEIINRTDKLFYPNQEVAGLGTWPSLLGGFSFALSNLFASSVQVYSTGILALQGDGPMRYTYMTSSDGDLGTPYMTWSDPTPPILETIRELAFRTALSFSDSSSQQTVHGSQLRTTTRYASSKHFLTASLAITFASTLAVMFLFYGFWCLGRPVTMSPLETVNAFQAPAMHDVEGFKTAHDLANHLLDTAVKYDIQQGKMMAVGLCANNEIGDASPGLRASGRDYI